MDIQEAVLQVFNVPTVVVSCLFGLLILAAQWKIFSKAGQAGWKCLIPIYSAYITVKIADGNGWKFLLLLVPIVNIVYAVMLTFRLAKAFGRGAGFAVGLLFLPEIFYLILGFGADGYVGPRGGA
ncbi:MAG: hypothetical protein IJK89_02090 [Clostridia bacterium]|nr:hypothetical protein [Clostridia bacterium]